MSISFRFVRTHKNNPSYIKRRHHKRLFRIVEGAVLDAMKSHPEYFTHLGYHSALPSITKRVVGAVLSNPKYVHLDGSNS